MTRIIDALKNALPGVAIRRSPCGVRRECVIIRMTPERGSLSRRRERLTLKFIAPTFDRARSMYLAARKAILSDGDIPTVGEGKNVLLISEQNGRAGAGYVAGTGMYHLTAAFTVTAYDKEKGGNY